MSDTELLTEYLASGSEECFSELVRRYVGLVFGTAVRMLRNPAAAEEISQQVFCALAREARGLRNPAALTAWLHRTTQQTAMMHLRTEQRRLRRERAVVESQLLADERSAWDDLVPVLDETMSRLKEKDRAAVLLRFFQSKPMAAVAADLGVSEPAAKMRIGRAIEKLRTLLAKRGVGCSAAGLLALLEDREQVSAAPVVVERIISASVKSLGAAKSIAPPLARSSLVLPAIVGAGLILTVIVGLLSFGRKASPPLASARAGLGSVTMTSAVPQAGQSLAGKPRNAPATLRLTVLDADAGQPVPGVLVTASSVGKGLGQAATDRNGSCVLPRPSVAVGDFYYYIRTQLAGYVSMEVSWGRYQSDVLSDIPSEYVLRIPHGVRVGGSVVDDSGQPVPEVEIRVRMRAAGGVPPREQPILLHGGSESILADQDGRWSFDRLPSPWNAAHFIISAPEYLKADYVSDATDENLSNEYQVPKQQLLEERAVLKVHGGIHVSGLVLDVNNQPVPGATLVQDLRFYEPWARSTAGLDGKYEILNARPGQLDLLVQASGYAPKAVQMRVDGPLGNAKIVLDRGAHVEGHVVDERGIDIPMAEIEVDRTGGPGQKFEWSATSDPKGWFAWDSAPAAGFEAVVIKPGFEFKHVFLKPNVTETIALSPTEERLIDVQGRVVDDERQEPIPVFRFSLSEDNHGFGPSRRGEDGTFTAKLSGTCKYFFVEVQANGFEPASIGQPVSSGDTPLLTFKLHRASGYSGTVLLPSGEPASNAEVGISEGMHSLMLGERAIMYKDESIIRRTDSNGRFHFGPRTAQMPFGRVLVAVHPQGYAECEADPPGRDIVLQLQPWGRIEGVLRSQDRPLANEDVFLTKRDWNPWLPTVVMMDPFRMKTDGQGRFKFESVPPGDLALRRQPFHSADVRATLQVRPGETTQVVVGGDGQAVTGRIIIPDFQTGFDFSHSSGELKRQQDNPVDLPWESRKDYPNEEAFQAAMKENGTRRLRYWQSEAGLAAWRQQRSYGLRFESDGTFHADDVAPGDYTLEMGVLEPRPGSPLETRPVLPWLTSVETVHVTQSQDPQRPSEIGAVVLKPKF
jgi:RNA polymerase sigma factor (sigma-70 family)